MPDSIITQLFDFGVLGIFAAFLIWQHVKMQKRLDSLVAEFQKQIKEIDASYDDRVDTLHTKYEGLLNQRRGASEEAAKLHDEVGDALTEIRNHLAFLMRVSLGGKED